MLRKYQITLALSVAWGFVPTVALAQQAPDSNNPITRLKEITVSATRTERSVDAVPYTVTVISALNIEQGGARDIKDLFRNEIDVSVRAAPSRFIAAGSANERGDLLKAAQCFGKFVLDRYASVDRSRTNTPGLAGRDGQ